METETLATPTKKTKRSPLQAIKEGENMIDIKLLMLTADAVRTVHENTLVWTLVGTDGYDYVNVTLWDKHFNRLVTELNNNFKGKNFMLKTFVSKHVLAPYNYGSVNYELRAQESSTITLIPELDKEFYGITENTYFNFLKQKLTIDDTFQPISYEKMRVGELFEDVELKLYSLKEIRTVTVKGRSEAKVLDVTAMANKTKIRLTAWNILAEFLFFLLNGKEGKMLKLQGIQIKEGVGKEEKAINFLNTSKIKVEECDGEMIEEELIVSLNEMAKKYGQIKCEVRLKVVRKPTIISSIKKQNGTICTDGVYKTQLIYPNTLNLQINDEITIRVANVETNKGVLTVTIYDEAALIKHEEKEIKKIELDELNYPEAI
uniref:Uncharacterized protein n=1 Tax=Meloidogyne floridensis TaxID=298350 RepID=A0A915NVB2_9BILA